jgi:hypothetical protein
MNKLLPLLSDGLIDILNAIINSNDSKIANELLEAHRLITSYNSLPGLKYFSNDLDVDLLQSVLESKINSIITDEVRALSIRRDVFEISFTPKGKELRYNDSGNWSRENRQTGKPGRIIKKLMVHEYKEKEIEVFNNLLKANMIALGEFKLVSGSDITKYYHEDSYHNISGTLGRSCMRYDECRSYFKIYEDHAKMLVCLRNGKVMGRAIVWEIDGNTYMDRVYVCEDYLEDQFIEYAKTNGWYRRIDNSLLSTGENQEWYTPSGDVTYECLTIKLKDRYDYYPYVDSFRYFNEADNTISTCDFDGSIPLDSTDGEIQGTPWTCDRCGEVYYSRDDETPDDLAWSEWNSEYLCPDCRVWCDGIDDYVNRDVSVVDVLVDRCFETYPLEYVKDNAVEPDDIEAIGDMDNFIKINGDWYRLDSSKLTVKDNLITIKD